MAEDNNFKKEQLIISENATMKEAMEAITANQKGAVIVVDEEDVLVGVLSDGDVRRGFLREASLITPVEKVMNVNYVFYQEGMAQNPADIFHANPAITILPLVDVNHHVLDVLVR